jgi:hypothetical protein
MLRKFLRLNLILAIVSSVIPARAILFQAPSAGSEEFQRFALERNQQTYTHWVLQTSVDSAPEAHPQVLEFSQRALQERSAKQRALEWDRLRQSIELNRADREVLTLLAEKLNLAEESCRYLLLEPDLASLLQHSQSPESCERFAATTNKNLPAQLGTNDVLVIDGKAFTKNQIPSRLVAGIYQWKIISDRYEDRAFTGTATEFSAQKFFAQNWVSGSCKDYNFENKDFAILVQAQIYFGSECVNPGIPKEKTFSEWANDHKGLLWGVGIIATGIAAAQLKDKTLVITKP